MTVADEIVKVAMIPVDAIIKLEKAISVRGIVFLFWTFMIGWFYLNGIHLPPQMGELYQAYALFYIGSKTSKIGEILKKK